MFNEQLLWEEECLRRGSQQYFDAQARKKLKANELGEASTFVLRDRLKEVAEVLATNCEGGVAGRNGAYNKLVRLVAGEDDDYLKVAYIGLKLLLAKIATGSKVKVSQFTARVGSSLEADLKCEMFRASEPAYFATVEKSFLQQSVTSAEHKQKVYMKKFEEFGLQWTPWTTQMKVHVGVRVLQAMLTALPDLVVTVKRLYRGKTDFFLDTTAGFDDWMAEFEKERGLLLPLQLPLKCKPRRWEDNTEGGYYTPRMTIPFIKTSGNNAKRYVTEHSPTQHKRAVNKMQDTSWRINSQVLRVQEEVFRRDLSIGIPVREPVEMTPFPEHLADLEKGSYNDRQKEEITEWKLLRKVQYDNERKRKGKVIGFLQAHLLAKELDEWDEFYYVYSCDFRGRVYCRTSALSPQGADNAKGLLQFAEGVRVGNKGIEWLAVQGANTYGNDKISYADRVTWIRDNEDLIKAIVDDPISNTMWGEADKPYQFLAFCFEWERTDFGRNPDAIGYLPVGLDGSCNGLQHFSAMLRDSVGAKATNLLPSDKPEDIYQEVADVVTKKLVQRANDGEALAKIWLQVGVSRKCTKQPVMTLPYGATQTSAKAAILEYVINNWESFNLPDSERGAMSTYLTPIVWQAIGEVVVAARWAMSWLQKNVGDGFCHWKTVIGFPVYQAYRDQNLIQIRTLLEGGTRLYVPDLNVGISKKSLQRSGIAPNFVHSIDSTHMILTVNAIDVPSYAMVHDDFGTHAGNTQELFTTIRRSFKHLYSKTDPLKHWADQMGVSTNGLPRGNYDIEEISNAEYFFG